MGTTGGTAGTSSGSGGAGAGGVGSGGVAGRGASGGAAGTGALSGAGGASAGGAGAGGGGTGGASPGVPSAGCGKAGKPANVTTSDHIYTFPASYDGTTPIPLFMGFHAAGNPIDQIQKLTNGSALEMNYVRAFGKSTGNEWVYNTDINKVYGWYDDLMATYCIDKSRVFAAGHSSGAQMIVQILTKADATMHMGFKAVAPVAASNYGAITAPIPVMYIQGKMDNVRNSDGADVVARFTSVNKCSSTSMAFADVATCKSGSTNVTPGCVKYDGCMEPTIWCSHNDPEYSNTNHGWPCFATKGMADFFATLP
jgi:polyhydroxybutyrate depolymerase